MVAASQNNVIGLNNDLPWHIPEDLKYFKDMTLNKALIMGRKTFESLGKPLPQRLHVVITRNKDFKINHPLVVTSFSVEEAINHCKQPKILNQYGNEIFITGGGEIFKQTIHNMNRLYITRIYKDYKGDAFYPEIPKGLFKEIKRTDRSQPVPFSFLVYEHV